MCPFFRRKRNLAATTAKLDEVYRELANDAKHDLSSDVSHDCGYVTSNGDGTAVTSVNGSSSHLQVCVWAHTLRIVFVSCCDFVTKHPQHDRLQQF